MVLTANIRFIEVLVVDEVLHQGETPADQNQDSAEHHQIAHKQEEYYRLYNLTVCLHLVLFFLLEC